MPIVRLATKDAFAPEDIKILQWAYNAVVARLGLPYEENTEQIAQTIIRLALGQEKLNAEALIEAALVRLRN